MDTLLFIIGLALIVSLIVIHEFGHFIVARRNGVEVEEFAIFFGPSIYKRRTKAGWIFRINTIPLGGYVKLMGEHDSDTKPGSYGAARLWVKSKIMIAGIVNNVIAALVILTVVALIGMPQLIPNQFSVSSNAHSLRKATNVVEVTEVLANSPASKAGLKDGDNITAIGPANRVETVTSVSSLQNITKKFAGKKVFIDYSKNNKKYQAQTTLNSAAEATSGKEHVYLGIAIGSYASSFSLIRYTWAAPIVAVGLTKQMIGLTFEGLWHAISGLGGIIAGAATSNHSAREKAQTTASNQFLGPYGIYYVLKVSSSAGIQLVLLLVGLISLALAIVNILPIPALDGGRLWLTLIFRAIHRPMSAKTEETVNAIGMLIMGALFIVLTYVDIQRFH